MADYVVSISPSSQMMIRDTGGNVEFWFKTGSATWNNDQQWSFFANGGSSGVLEYRLVRGGHWQHFGTVYVGYNQTVNFTIYGAGIGFPTYSFDQFISRSTVPPPPTLLTANPVSTTQVHVTFQGNGDGGSPITGWQVGYGSSSAGPSATVPSGGNTVVGGFSSGQKVYFWSRGGNALGWSAWSNRLEATTWRIPDAPTPVVFSNITQISISTQFTDGFNGGTAVLERQLGYGLNPTTPAVLVNSPSGINHLSDLQPGGTYYFWARERNSVGWGPWSARSHTNLIAGARVLVGTEWKRAVPYVRVSGEWKVARPWVRHEGVWKETSI